jgi:hypothetical protein
MPWALISRLAEVRAMFAATLCAGTLNKRSRAALANLTPSEEELRPIDEAV